MIHITLRISKLLINKIDEVVEHINELHPMESPMTRSQYIRNTVLRAIKGYWRRNT